MYDAILRLFISTKKLIVAKNAVKKGWITSDEYLEITGESFESQG